MVTTTETDIEDGNDAKLAVNDKKTKKKKSHRHGGGGQQSKTTKKTVVSSPTLTIPTRQQPPPQSPSSKVEKKPTLSQSWSNCLQKIRRPIGRMVCQLAMTSARFPWTTVVVCTVLTVGLLITGIVTNITFESEDDVLFTPFKSLPPVHRRWIDDTNTSNFPPLLRDQNVLLHQQGTNILEDCPNAFIKAFDVLDALVSLEQYNVVCGDSGSGSGSGDGGNRDDDDDDGTLMLSLSLCPWSSITQFFNNSRRIFEDSPSFNSNEECLKSISRKYFPNGQFVLTNRILGNPTYHHFTNTSSDDKNETATTSSSGGHGHYHADGDSLLVSADSTFHILGLPLEENVRLLVEEYEAAAIDKLFDVQETWNNNNVNNDNDINKNGTSSSSPSSYVLEQFNESSFSIEFGNGFLENIPFLAAAFTLMTLFTAVVFWKCDPVKSRVAVGLGATATVTMGMAAAFGLLFICGVPMTSIHGMLPFILVGVGLDDAFIITNEFYRMSPDLPIEERMYKTIDEVGLSIVTTTVTSAVAFGLGCISSIPAVYWLCLYAFPAIIVDFFFAVTLFVAIIVIDERRVQQRRRDVLCCFSVKEDENNETESDVEVALLEDTIIDRFMDRYASCLMNPAVKGLVILVFSGLFAACVYSTTQLKQEFTVELVLPSDTYVVPFLDSVSQYTTNGDSQATLYFRNIDHSTLEGQQAMEAYVNDMVELEGISTQPENFWLRDFHRFIKNNTVMEGLSFNEQIASFLDVPTFHALYDKDIARNEQGDVTASRVTLAWDLVGPDDVTAQITALEDQEWIARIQSVNDGVADGKDWFFFSFDDEYFIWSFFKACPEELTLTVIMGVVAVSLISIVAIPHWSAIFFSAPLIMILYVDLMGVLQFAGITINSVSYITLAVSIGLMVDFLIHILLRYFESEKPSREEKVEDTLRTMGASVAIGGFTTFLGVLPLAFNTTGIFEVVFVTFVSLVVLGLSHGLIFLPVLLSLFGSEDPVLASLKKGNTFDKPIVMIDSTHRAET